MNERRRLLVGIYVVQRFDLEVLGQRVELQQHVAWCQGAVRVARDPDGGVLFVRLWMAQQRRERAALERLFPAGAHANSCSAHAPKLGMSSRSRAGITHQRSTCSPSGTW